MRWTPEWLFGFHNGNSSSYQRINREYVGRVSMSCQSSEEDVAVVVTVYTFTGLRVAGLAVGWFSLLSLELDLVREHLGSCRWP